MTFTENSLVSGTLGVIWLSLRIALFLVLFGTKNSFVSGTLGVLWLSFFFCDDFHLKSFLPKLSSHWPCWYYLIHGELCKGKCFQNALNSWDPDRAMQLLHRIFYGSVGLSFILFNLESKNLEIIHSLNISTLIISVEKYQCRKVQWLRQIYRIEEDTVSDSLKCLIMKKTTFFSTSTQIIWISLSARVCWS